jgi:hypothetical protein
MLMLLTPGAAHAIEGLSLSDSAFATHYLGTTKVFPYHSCPSPCPSSCPSPVTLLVIELD